VTPTAGQPAYWEKFARDLGWDEERVLEAGRVGSLAVTRGMTPTEALDVVVARVRDGRDVRVGPSRWELIRRNEGVPALLGGVVAFLAVGIGAAGESAGTAYPVYFTAVVAAEVVLVIRGLVHRRWRLSLLGALLTAVAFVLFAGSLVRA
jgi:hypothetical protein